MEVEGTRGKRMEGEEGGVNGTLQGEGKEGRGERGRRLLGRFSRPL